MDYAMIFLLLIIFWWKWKRSFGLKLNIQKTKIMALSPITSWQIDGETVDTVADFIFLGSKITADVDCSQEIKRRLLLGRKVMTNLLLLLLSHFSRVRLCVTPYTAAHQGPPSLWFSFQAFPMALYCILSIIHASSTIKYTRSYEPSDRSAFPTRRSSDLLLL